MTADLVLRRAALSGFSKFLAGSLAREIRSSKPVSPVLIATRSASTGEFVAFARNGSNPIREFNLIEVHYQWRSLWSSLP
ncbi:MAG: hypothetical protein WCT12_30785 [Verrucomicrobiota bacterium]